MSNYQNKEKNLLSIVIHVKENVELLPSFIENIEANFAKHFEHYEYILVNNSKSNNLNQLLENLEVIGEVNIVNLAWQHNIENAMSAGIDLAIGDFVLEIDSLSKDYPESLLTEVYNQCLQGFDMVAASPKKSKSTDSRWFYYLLNKLSYKNIQLQTESFRIVSRRMINRTNTEKSTFKYRKANYHGSGLKTTFLTYTPIKTKSKAKDYSLWEKLSLASNILIYYSSVGTKLSSVLSLIFFVISVAVGVYAIVSYLVLQNDIQEGWTTTMLFLSIGFAGFFAILAVLSKYMEVLLKSTHVKHQYTYLSVDKLNKNK